MTCRHCGADLTSDETSCRQCGYDPQESKPFPERPKVISFRHHQQAARRASRRRLTMSSTMWWLLVIVAVSLMLPYLLPVHS